MFAILNARYHEQEAYIVSQAGVPGAITIATNMAGRGTDIQLGGNADMRIRQELADIEDWGERDKHPRAAEIREQVKVLKMLSGIATLGFASPEAAWAGALAPTGKVMVAPGAEMSAMTRPESRPSHSRELGADSADSAMPASSPNRSVPSPWLTFISRCLSPSACSSAHW